jgi:polyribonucleotide 5'-hydroxyl-kinase
MALNKEYTFLDENVAVFTWYGCVVESTGTCQIYESDSTPMVAYVNTHCQLEAIRDVALYNSDFGPKVMIVGPKDHGKSSMARILSSYAARLDRTPILVDLDVGQGSLCIPGCICAVPLDKSILSVEVSRSPS